MDNLTGSMKDLAFATSPREFDLSYSTTIEEIMEKLAARRAAFQMPFQIKGGVPGQRISFVKEPNLDVGLWLFLRDGTHVRIQPVITEAKMSVGGMRMIVRLGAAELTPAVAVAHVVIQARAGLAQVPGELLVAAGQAEGMEFLVCSVVDDLRRPVLIHDLACSVRVLLPVSEPALELQRLCNIFNFAIDTGTALTYTVVEAIMNQGCSQL